MIHYFLLKIRDKYTKNVIPAKYFSLKSVIYAKYFSLKSVVYAKYFSLKSVVYAKCLVSAYHEQGNTDEEMDDQVQGGDQDIGARIGTKSHIVNFLNDGR